MKKLRYYDLLTELYNLNGFSFQAQEHLTNSKLPAALAVIDIQGLAFINKSYGVIVGDKVLKEVGKRLTNIFRKRDIIGRTGDDEFSILFIELKNKDNVLIVENKLKKAFNEPFFIDGAEVKVRIVGGISVYPDDATDFLILYNNAVLALKEAKKSKQHFIKFFDQEMEKRANDFFSVDNLLEKAVKKDLFIFHYQPYFNARDLSIAGFEALARIRDKDGKIYFPNTFINVLENSHLLDRFTEWVLQESVSKGKKWGVPISVNISANTFKQREFSRKVLSYINNVEKNLILEITERVFMDDIENCKNAIHELKVDSKIQIAIDDFGTGYSSLSYLKDLSADILKIDISFVRAMVEDKKSKALVESIIYIGKSLGMKTLAEGVETKQQLEMLQQFGVDYVQGYYLSKPMPEENVDILLTSNPS